MSLLRLIAMGLFASALAVHGQEQGDYVDGILAGSEKQLTRGEFLTIEKKAFREFADPASYAALSDLFLGTTEGVWALVYAETYCNLAPASSKAGMLGLRIATLIQKALSTTPDGFAISLSKSSELVAGRQQQGQLPFETDYEISMLLAMTKADIKALPLNLARLDQIRQAQVDILSDKLGPGNALLDRLVSIRKAGHFQAYDYSLFQEAFPKEFEAWQATHRKAHQDWLAWQHAHPFQIPSNGFHRLAEALSEGAMAEVMRRGPGFGPWRFGMSKTEVASFSPFGPYLEVRSTSGLETAKGEFEARPTNISFVFDQLGLGRIQVWAYEGKDEQAALEATARVYRHLHRDYGSVEAPSLASPQDISEAALLNGVRSLWASTSNTEMAKLQMAPTTMPADKTVFASIIRHPAHGFYVFLYFVRP